MKKVLFAVRKELFPSVFSAEDYGRIAGVCRVLDVEVPEAADKDFLIRYGRDADIIVSSWGTETLGTDVIANCKNLSFLAHAAGSVKPVVSDALWSKGVRVSSSAVALAYGVAEFCLGLMLTAPKRVFWGMMNTRQGKWRDGLDVFGGPFEIYQQQIGIIGASHVGRHLIKLLKNFGCNILLYDPYCSRKDAESMKVTKVETLDEIFSQCRVVSLNAPSTEGTKQMIRGSHFAQLPAGAVFINTARGAIVHQAEMVEELKKGRFVACIDVTDPEPPAADDPLRSLPNVILTPHQAGAIAENRLRMGTIAIDEIVAFVNNEPLCYEVTHDALSYIA